MNPAMKKAAPYLRILFLVLFFVLFRLQALLVWLALYALSLLFPLLIGRRVYCMLVCPIHTVMLGSHWLKGRLGLRERAAPKALRFGWLSWLALALTVAVFIISRRLLGRDLPVMILWIVIAFVITLFYHPDVFHDQVCPYSVPQKGLAKLSLRSEEGRDTARNYQGFTKSVMQAGGKQPNGKK